uniref:CID domain-containing protein n=1 Tax=Megaselia scalaris TaxID=36166 RepID=T1GBT7_MEGSC
MFVVNCAIIYSNKLFLTSENKMSAFTESALTTKLQALNSSQQSIQTFLYAPENKKLTFLYLANDVIQNSKKKGPEYGKEFFNCLPRVFTYIGNECSDEKLFRSLERILTIWEERSVYDKATISDYRNKLNKGKESHEGSTPEQAPKNEKRKVDEENGRSKKLKNNDTLKSSDNGTSVDPSMSLSPHIPLGDPPEPEKLIEVLTKLMDHSAASDVIIFYFERNPNPTIPKAPKL